MREVIVTSDDKSRDGESITHERLRIHAEHLVGRVVHNPGPRVVHIVPCVQRFEPIRLLNKPAVIVSPLPAGTK